VVVRMCHPNLNGRVTECRTFQRVDLSNLELDNGEEFPNVYMFREAIRQYNVLKGNDICFKKIFKYRVCVVCKDKNCEYRYMGIK
jgi:hypothetical protein